MEIDYELVVDEPIKGHFYWLLSVREAPGKDPSVVDFAHGPMPTHRAAADAGSAALRWHRTARSGARAVLSGIRADWYVETMPAELR
ncbi:hypothetical protein [Variovorax soli]|uniref:Uncharacterized protein n=1 Tax=Variovorax soli TaxID=376815 RepID=A0ABU1NCR7_9BURK|nr:hypothetical protein [Variovorax soli]MDR6536258.1 hypothetical protein [Variovorax soli]